MNTLVGLGEFKVISRVKKRSIYKRVFFILLAVFILQFALVVSFMLLGDTPDDEAKTDYLLILGAGLDGETPSLSLLERLKTGCDYLKKYPDTVVIVSGGQGRGERITEAEAMKRYLVRNGIEESRIVMETRATSTMENFRYARQLIEEMSGSSTTEITFVTNRFHIFRSRILAGRNGLRAAALASSDFQGIELKYLREYFAIIKSLIFDW